MSRSSQIVLARRSFAARLNSGFLNCIRGARSEYLGTRRLRASGSLPAGPTFGAGAFPVAAGASAEMGASGVLVASGLFGWMVWVMAASGATLGELSVLEICGPTTVVPSHSR